MTVFKFSYPRAFESKASALLQTPSSSMVGLCLPLLKSTLTLPQKLAMERSRRTAGDLLMY